VFVNTCRPTAQAPRPAEPPPARDACHDLAAVLVDLIEDSKMNSAAFVKAAISRWLARRLKPTSL
jgi:hypothetical protein